MPTSDKFRDYLLAALPEEYPIASIPLSLKMEDAHRKELVYQQGKFLQAADQYIHTHPWIAFIAANKHNIILIAHETSTMTFREISDKEYFDNVEQHKNSIINSIEGMLDEATMLILCRLVYLQTFNGLIKSTIKTVKAALEMG